MFNPISCMGLKWVTLVMSKSCWTLVAAQRLVVFSLGYSSGHTDHSFLIVRPRDWGEEEFNSKLNCMCSKL